MRYNELLKEYRETSGFVHDDYKIWQINVAKKKTPDGKIRGNAVHKKYKDQVIGPIDGSSVEEVMRGLKKLIDDRMIGQRRGLEGAKGLAVPFNAEFTRQIFDQIGDITAARFAKNNEGQTVLQILDPEWFEEMGATDGFTKIAPRKDIDSEEAVIPYAFSPSMKLVKNLGLEANGRYTVEQNPKHTDDPYWEFAIDHHSTAHDKSERMRLPGPGFNIAVW